MDLIYNNLKFIFKNINFDDFETVETNYKKETKGAKK